MEVSDKEMKEPVRLTSDVRSARKNLERATKARSAISNEIADLLDENITGTDPATREKNSKRIETLLGYQKQINEGTYQYPPDGPDFAKYLYTWGSFRLLRSFMVLCAWLLVAIIAWTVFS